MSRVAPTISRFKGMMSGESVVNIPPNSAINCQNVYVDNGGWLNVCQLPTTLIDWSGPDNAATNLSAILSLGWVPTAGQNPRLLIQQGKKLMWSDFPYASATLYTGGDLAGILARLDYAVSGGITYFANGQQTGYVLPKQTGNTDTRWSDWGILPPLAAPTLTPSSTYSGSITLQRTGGIVTATFGSPHNAVLNGPIYIDQDPSATWPANFAGVWKVSNVVSPTVLEYQQPGLPDAGPFTRATFPPGLTATTGFKFGVCYGNSEVVHWSSLSAWSASTGALTDQSPVLLIPPSDDPQVDSAALFRTQDGGGTMYLTNDGSGLNTLPYFSGAVKAIQDGPYAGYYVFIDETTDAQLTTSGQTAPYDNGVAPNCKYLAVWLDRILGCGIPGDQTGVKFTGYDSINFGRPQMCWCAYNEIKLGQGEAIPNGMGLLRYGGMVFFGNNKRMYVYRGTLNDITISAPTSLSFYAEELPYGIGCYSHFSIQSTPAGLVWLDDGLNLRVFENSGFYPPKSLSPNLSGIFKRITPGSQDQIESAYVNWEQRDWYILCIPVDGSLTNNMMIIVDMTQDPAHNAGIFPTTYGVAGLEWLQYADQSRHLLAAMPYLPNSLETSNAGFLTDIPLIDNILQGTTDQRNPVSANGPMPGAYWQGGYHGIHDESGADVFDTIKKFRYMRYSSTLQSGIKLSGFLVDLTNSTFDQPEPIDVDTDGEGNVGGINRKSRAFSPLIQFPDDATTCAAFTSLMLTYVQVAVR